MELDGFLEFSEDDGLAGFRLDRIELYNWGTFHDTVWEFPLKGRNGLLTGDIGSGKSTVVDAVTTLLVPPSKIRYNKAAGAERKERSLKSYVLGHYKSERSDEGHAAKPVPLRGKTHYTVILAVFRNDGYNQQTTLAQIFWQKESAGPPARMYVISDIALSIKEHFSDFGGDMNTLRKQLRNLPHTEKPFDSFSTYGAAFQRRFGLQNEQALELFHQTVSMKSIGNLTSFVREHMLEAFDVETRIQALISHFSDLDRSHQAVLKAKDQIERLDPLLEELDQYKEISDDNLRDRESRDGLLPYFSHLKKGLVEERLLSLNEQLEKKSARKEKLEHKWRGFDDERDSLKQAIYENGGNRLEKLKLDVNRLEDEKNQRLNRFNHYSEHSEPVGLKAPASEESFTENRKLLEKMETRWDQEERDAENRRSELQVDFADQNRQNQELEKEIISLESRKSNIPYRQLNIRQQLCRALSIHDEELPFAGELIKVRDSESAWEGAIERVMHNFAQSLLVPETHYTAVSDWVNGNRLQGRLVFFKTASSLAQKSYDIDDDSLLGKLELKEGSPFLNWLEEELRKRFNFSCCTDMTAFRRARKALTPKGLIKGGGHRHEKDDRHSLTDRSRYVLGWINKDKISALKGRQADLKRAMNLIAENLDALDRERKKRDQGLKSLYALRNYTSFRELDWQDTAAQAEVLKKEMKSLESASDILHQLNEKLKNIEEERKTLRVGLDKLYDETARLEERISTYSKQIQDLEEKIAASPLSSEQWQPVIQALMKDILGDFKLSVENCDARQQDIRISLQNRIDSRDRKVARLSQSIVRQMQEFRNLYPSETAEMDASLEGQEEFRSLADRLHQDDLPQFEVRFKELLNENTIREIANFQAQLNRERKIIEDRIEKINRSMSSIEYNKDRYIILDAMKSNDTEIRQFRQDLKSCTEGTLGGNEDDQYTELKFLQVSKIIDRFRGREGSSDLDRRWTAKVTDVRNWFDFAASERWKEDDSEYEHHTNSGGKSGGQKEKLAYTVLAASLAYQFGLEFNEVRSRSFRFVVIDEAFGRGSDESARYGLELFKKLNLQLLVITPLQKIHIIEPYVSSVGFVHNEEGKRSLLRNFTIQEFRQNQNESPV